MRVPWICSLLYPFKKWSLRQTRGDSVLTERASLLAGQLGLKNIKDVSRDLFEAIRRITEMPNLGSNREEFASQFLVPTLAKTQVVYEELREDVFGSD